MYGPPGCGKTFIVKAAAGECKSGLINAKLSDLLDMYVGNTERIFIRYSNWLERIHHAYYF